MSRGGTEAESGLGLCRRLWWWWWYCLAGAAAAAATEWCMQ